MADIFGPIGPAPVVDSFIFDFTLQIGSSGTITGAVWTCAVDPASLIPDPTPAARILGSPAYSTTKTSALIGNMIDGCLYTLEATATISDQRVLRDSASLQCTSAPTIPISGEACEPLIPVAPIDACIVQFDYARWSLRYPEFAPTGKYPVSSALAQEYFYDATMYLDNTCDSPVCDASIGGERERLLYLMTAHLAQVNGAGSATGAPTPGRITNKSVGPVSVGYGGLEGLSANAAWFAQTAYGFAFWTATAAYRTFRYRVPFIPYNFPSWAYYR